VVKLFVGWELCQANNSCKAELDWAKPDCAKLDCAKLDCAKLDW
jgi:hypothetical protein